MSKNNFLQKFTLIYFAMIATITFFGLAVYFLCQNGMAGSTDDHFVKQLSDALAIVVPLFFIAAHFVFRSMVKRINLSLDLEQKLVGYGVALLVRSAFLEVPGLLISVMALLTGRVSVLLLLPLVVITFIVLRPKAVSIASDLNLSIQEKESLEI